MVYRPELVVMPSPDYPIDLQVVGRLLDGRVAWRAEILGYPEATPEGDQDLISRLGNAEALFVRDIVVSRSVIERVKSLCVITTHGAGLDQVDVQAATDNGVLVTNAPGANANAVAELAIGLLLALFRRIPRAAEVVQREGGWGEGRWLGLEMRGKTLGIIGLGNIGKRVIPLARAFGMEVIAHHPRLSDEQISALSAVPASLDTLLQTSDVVSLHLPLTDATRHLIGARELAMMKQGAFLVNTARGPIVDGRALYAALADGRLGGAALDVLEKEPPDAGDPLCSLDNIIVTPHMGGSTRECLAAVARIACEDILRVFAGERPVFLANPQVMEANPRILRR